MLEMIWTEEQQREIVKALSETLGIAGAAEVARRCCYPGVLRFMRFHVPVEQQAELIAEFLKAYTHAAELGQLLARLNCWMPVLDEAMLRAQSGIKLVSRAEAEAAHGRFPVVQPINKPQVETLRGALHMMVTAMTVGRRGLLGDWSGKPVFDAEAIFQAAVDELLAGTEGFAVRCARIFLAGGWPAAVADCGRLVVGRLA